MMQTKHILKKVVPYNPSSMITADMAKSYLSDTATDNYVDSAVSAHQFDDEATAVTYLTGSINNHQGSIFEVVKIYTP
jgi:hypothetical protein